MKKDIFKAINKGSHASAEGKKEGGEKR